MVLRRLPLTLATSAGLSAHARDRHWGARGPVTCPVRGCGFISIARHQTRHLRAAHTREMFFVCDSCGKKFADLDAKAKHVKRCPGPQLEVCGGCQRLHRSAALIRATPASFFLQFYHNRRSMMVICN